jgi:hypothetical protein
MGDTPVQNIHFIQRGDGSTWRLCASFRIHDREKRRAKWRGKVKREIWESSGGTGIIKGYGERIMNTYNLEFETRRC